MSGDGIHRKEIPEIPVDAIREAVVNSFAHARYDLSVQHEVDIFSNRISICNPGSFANEFEPIDFYTRDIHSYLRNEVIAKTLYLCKEAGIEVSYVNEETAFVLEFSREDRNIPPKSGGINGGINESELTLLSVLKQSPSITNAELANVSEKSERTISRILAALKSKKLIERIGSNKSGYWKVL